MRHLAFALAAAVLAAVPALSQPVTQNASAPLNRDALDTIVCHEYAAETGSRIGKRMVCLTNRQWNEIHRQAREGYNEEIKKAYTLSH
jgi:hypothetical protein